LASGSCVNWDLYGGLAFDVGVKVEALDRSLADYSLPGIIDFRTFLDRHECPSGGTVDVITFDYDPGVVPGLFRIPDAVDLAALWWSQSGYDLALIPADQINPPDPTGYEYEFEYLLNSNSPPSLALGTTVVFVDLRGVSWDIDRVEVDVVNLGSEPVFLGTANTYTWESNEAYSDRHGIVETISCSMIPGGNLIGLAVMSEYEEGQGYNVAVLEMRLYRD